MSSFVRRFGENLSQFVPLCTIVIIPRSRCARKNPSNPASLRPPSTPPKDPRPYAPDSRLPYHLHLASPAIVRLGLRPPARRRSSETRTVLVRRSRPILHASLEASWRARAPSKSASDFRCSELPSELTPVSSLCTASTLCTEAPGRATGSWSRGPETRPLRPQEPHRRP